MERRKGIKYILLIFVLLLLAGCRSAKRDGAGVAYHQLQQMQALKPLPKSLSAKLKLSAEVGVKPLSSGGSLKIQDGHGINIGITALGIFEVAYLQFTPVDAFLVNKVGKEYAVLNYSEVAFLGQAGIDYYMLQNVLMNRPFSPDGSNFVDALPSMGIKRLGDELVVTTPVQNRMQYTFRFSISTGELIETSGMYDNRVKVECKYSDFEKLGESERSFPTNISVEVNGVGEAMHLNLELSKIKTDDYIFKKGNVSSYKRMELKRLIDSL